ncbi:MAG: hypothetical protein WDO24_03825 [Pseudomonadota bacterium]
MHPALSVILFTTASGAGYGLLILLALFGALGQLPAETGFGIAAFALSLGLISFGLLASTFHLGPSRAGLARHVAMAHLVAEPRGRGVARDLSAGARLRARLDLARQQPRRLGLARPDRRTRRGWSRSAAPG